MCTYFLSSIKMASLNDAIYHPPSQKLENVVPCDLGCGEHVHFVYRLCLHDQAWHPTTCGPAQSVKNAPDKGHTSWSLASKDRWRIPPGSSRSRASLAVVGGRLASTCDDCDPASCSWCKSNQMEYPVTQTTILECWNEHPCKKRAKILSESSERNSTPATNLAAIRKTHQFPSTTCVTPTKRRGKILSERSDRNSTPATNLVGNRKTYHNQYPWSSKRSSLLQPSP